MHQRRARAALAVAGLIAVILPLIVAPTASAARPRDRSPGAPALLTQTLDWSECYPDAGFPELQCAAVTVPRDWAQPAGPTITVSVSRVLATHPDQRRGVLFTNPGGPGGSGLTLPLFIELSEPSIAAAYDVIGIDPRGVGSSTQLNCGQGDTLDRLYNLNGRDTSRGNQARFRRLNADYARQCSTDPLTPVIDTPHVVRDLDLIRALLGERTISYLGFSAGTALGTWYASVFPQHVDRMVLDGNLEFTARSSYTSALRQPAAFQNSFENFFERWAARHDDVYGLGGSRRAVDRTYERRRAALAARPLTLADGSQLTASGYDSGIAGGLYWTGYYPELATVLTIVERYDTATVAEQQQVTDWFGSVTGNGDDVFWSVSCQDTPGPSYGRVVRDTMRFRRTAPLIGANWNVYPCPFFTLPINRSPIRGELLPRLLMLNNSDDPATPYRNAVEARARTPRAVLVTIRNQPDHTIYGVGDACADGYVNRYLLTGRLPSGRPSCPGVALPVPVAPDASTAGQQRSASQLGGMTAWAWVQQFTRTHGAPTVG